MNKKIMQANNNSNWMKPISYAIIMLIGIAIGLFVKGNLSFKSLSWSAQSPMQELMEIVQSKYVDSLSNTDSATLKVADFYLAQLDPHSVYIPPSDLSDVEEQLSSNLTGIGIEFQQFRDSIFVTSVLKESPAQKAGLQLGDILLTADDSILLSGNKNKVDYIRSKIKGLAETEVKLRIKRKTAQLTLMVTRGNIPVSSIDSYYMINDTTGYIRINKFASRTYEAFMQALEPLLKRGMTSLVIDLRNNGGGLLSEAVGIADELLPGNKLIVYTQGAHSPRQDYFSKRDGLFEQGKLTILMNESSASASEVLAGALQDWDRATIVGTMSFGKGLVQQQFRLSNGGALRLTTAKYYTPLGRNIQRPYDKGKLAYEDDFISRIHKGAIGDQDSSFKGKSYKTPKGKIVYGGGGIYPDKWVSTSAILMDTNYIALLISNVFNNFAFQYYLANELEINKFKTVQEFIQVYRTKNTWASLNNYLTKEQQILLAKSFVHKEFIQNQIVALLVRLKWNKEGYYEAINSMDPTFSWMLP